MKSNLQIGPSFNGNFNYKIVKEVVNGEVKYFEKAIQTNIEPHRDAYFSGGLFGFLMGENKPVEITAGNIAKKVETIISDVTKKPITFTKDFIISPEYTGGSPFLKKASFITKNPEENDIHVFYEA